MDETLRWFHELPPEFAFLLALPFVVAAVGIAAGLWRERRALSRPAERRREGTEGRSRRDRRRPASSTS
jgi:hypothetical protein